MLRKGRSSRPLSRRSARRRGRGGFRRFIERVLFLAAFVLLGIVAAGQLDLLLHQRYQSWRLARLVERGLLGDAAVERAVKSRAEAAASGLVGRIEIQRLGLSAIVSEGEDEATLAHAVGHLPRSAFPGEAGNVVLAGHRDSLFRSLEKIRLGDRVLLITPDGRFGYRVEDIQVVDPDHVEVLKPTRHQVLTLITCYPFRFIGDAPRRFVVRADAIEIEEASWQPPPGS